MKPPCPNCGGVMVAIRLDHGDHWHPMFVCICGADVVLFDIHHTKE